MAPSYRPILAAVLMLACLSCNVPRRKSIMGVIRYANSGKVVENARVQFPQLNKTVDTDCLGFFRAPMNKSYEKRTKAVDRLVVSKNGTTLGTYFISRNLPFLQILVPDDPGGTPPTPVPPTADMHFHVSMKYHNEYGLKSSPANRDTYGLWAWRHKKLKVPYKGKWRRPGRPRPIDGSKVATSRREQRKYKKLQMLYEGMHVRPANNGNALYQYTQATLPHLKGGNVKLAFNAISPFEYNLSNHGKKRLFGAVFKSKGRFKWLRKIGGFNRRSSSFTLTHWDNFQAEYDLLKKQDLRYNGFEWKILRSGRELENDPTGNYVVNVLEGAHALQGPYSMIELENLREKDKKVSRSRLNRLSKRELNLIRSLNPPDSAVAQRVDQIERFTLPGGLRLSNKIPTLNQRREQTHRLLDSLIKVELSDNIARLKSDSLPFFMVTISHLAWNGMTGHSPALDTKGIGRPLLKRFYRIKASDDKQVIGQWKDIFYTEPAVNAAGRLVIDRLLSRAGGQRRILIDLKHSDYTTRKYFFDSVMTREATTSRLASSTVSTEKEKIIPPICSHCAVNGLKEYNYSPFVDEYSLIRSSVDDVFYPLGMNLYDEEIAKICQNNGIIGITLEERVLGGIMKPDRRINIQNRFYNIRKGGRQQAVFGDALTYNEEELDITNEKRSYKLLLKDYMSLEPFLQNLFHVLDNVGEIEDNRQKVGKAAWSHVCIGSDLDGIIDPINICPTANQYPYLRKRMEHFIRFFLDARKAGNPAARGYEDYFDNSGHGDNKISLPQALDALFYQSLQKFVVKHFN